MAETWSVDGDRDPLQKQIDDLADQVALNQEILAELQADGLVNQKQVDQLERALMSSRTIGAAIGIIMGKLDVDLDQAFAVLRRISQDENRKLRDVATEIVTTRSIDVVTNRGRRARPAGES